MACPRASGLLPRLPLAIARHLNGVSLSAIRPSERLYLDYNATAPLRPEARAAAIAVMEAPANPSSIHAEGRRARAILEGARRAVAGLVGGRPDGVVFTSGATEAAHLALTPDLIVDGRAGIDRLIVAAVEHAAVLRGHRFPAEAVAILPVLESGSIDLVTLGGLLAVGERALVAIQVANNETGVIQPIAEIADVVRAAGGVLVCDAVQAPGRIDCSALGADILLLSGHKLGGLVGAGALVLTSDRTALGGPVLRGGGQERGFRAGTENVPALAAFGAAAAVAGGDAERLRRLRDQFEASVVAMAPDAEVFGRAAERLPNTCAFAVPGVTAERLVMAFDLAGIAVSSGSACASGLVGRSHVLEAMGTTPDLRAGAIRVSFGWNSTEGDAARAAAALNEALDRMRGRRIAVAA